MNWFAVRIRPQHRLEFTVLHALTQRDHPAMVPFEEKLIRNSRTKRPEPRKYPLFPCYVFAGFSSYHEFLTTRAAINERAEQIGKRPPIVNLVGFGGKPATLAPDDVRFLQTLSLERPTAINLHKALKPGMNVRVLSGAWRDRVGQLRDIDRKRITIMFEMFNAMMPVELPSATAVEAA